MNLKVRLLLLWLAAIPLGMSAQGIADILEALGRTNPYVSEADVEMRFAGSEEDAPYALRLYSSAIADTTIAPCRYLIEWNPLGSGETRGFAAFTGDRLYRYSSARFLEYSLADETLTPRLARSAMFANLLPPFLAKNIADDIHDPSKTVEVVNAGPDRIAVETTTRADSVVVSHSRLLLSLPGLAPVAYSMVSGEGTPMESGMRATWSAVKEAPQPVGKGLLMSRHGELMRRFAGANRCPGSFLDMPMPPFTLPDALGGRYTFRPGNETILVIIDDEVDPDMLEDMTQNVRYALASHPRGAEIDILYIILSRFTDAIRASDAPSGHERLLLGGRALAKELGAISFPLIVSVDEKGNVAAVAEGVNKDPGAVVIDMLK